MKIDPELIKQESNTAEVVLLCEEGAATFPVDGNQSVDELNGYRCETDEYLNKMALVSGLSENISANDGIILSLDATGDNVAKMLVNEQEYRNVTDHDSIAPFGLSSFAEAGKTTDTGSITETPVLRLSTIHTGDEDVVANSLFNSDSHQNRNGDCAQELSLEEMLATIVNIDKNTNFLEFSTTTTSTESTNKSRSPVEMSLRKVISSGDYEAEESRPRNQLILDPVDGPLDCVTGNENSLTSSGSNVAVNDVSSAASIDATVAKQSRDFSQAAVQNRSLALDGPDPGFAADLASRSSAKKSRRVTFPNDDKMVHGYLNPQIPWKDGNTKSFIC